MDWKQELLKRLDALAEKLGTTGVYLWSVLMRQAIAEGISTCIDAACVLCAAAIAGYFSRFCWKKARNEKHDPDPWYAGSIVLLVITIMVASIGFDVLADGIKHFYNPAYYALHEVMQTLERQ